MLERIIYTLTLNPSLDCIIKTEKLNEYEVNRYQEARFFPGGKGVNVSRVLNKLGVPNTALGFAGDIENDFVTGEFLRLLKESDCFCDFIHIKNAQTRLNIKMIGENYKATEMNAAGFKIEKPELDKLFLKLERIPEESILIMSGSAPKGYEIIYSAIANLLKGKNIYFFLDTSGEALKIALGSDIFLIKPNSSELGELYGVEIKNVNDAIFYSEKLHAESGANVLSSLGEHGAVLIAKNGKRYVRAADKGKVLNPVGAGDSMLAGFVAEISRSADYEKALEVAVKTGCKAVFSDWLSVYNQV